MNILLINNPTKSYIFNNFNIPHLGLLSIASNLNKKHNVKIIDDFYDPLVINKFYSKKNYENYNLKIYDTINEFKPDIIGLTAMTFQYSTAKKIANVIKENFKNIIIVLGGYHATLMYDEIYNSEDKKYFDIIVRKEGEITFNDLVNKIENKKNLSEIKGISYCIDNKVYHNPDAEIIDLNKINIPDRTFLKDSIHYWYNFILNKFETATVLETSRGCIYSCKFCSITKMYGKSFRKYDLNRVIDDLYNIKENNNNIERILIIDDNITLDIERLEKLCDLIIKNGFNSFKYFIQASSIGLSKSKTLIKKLKSAGIDYIFIGIENVDKNNLNVLGKGDIVDRSKLAVKYLNRYGIASWGGGIIGAPEDSKKEIKNLYKTYKKYKVTFPGIQILNPYPKTQIREEYLEKNLVTNIDNYDNYEGFWANIRTNYLTSDELLYYNLFEQIKFEILKKGLSFFYLRNYPLKFIKSLFSNYFKYLVIKSNLLNENKKYHIIDYIESQKQFFLNRMNNDFLFNWNFNKDKNSELNYDYTNGIKAKTIKIKYKRSSNGWWEITNHIFMKSFDYTGIEFYIKGTENMIRIQIRDNEGKFWVHNVIPHSEWEKINIPFSNFKIRKEFQPPETPRNTKFKISNLLLFDFINSFEEQSKNGEFVIDKINVYK